MNQQREVCVFNINTVPTIMQMMGSCLDDIFEDHVKLRHNIINDTSDNVKIVAKKVSDVIIDIMMRINDLRKSEEVKNLTEEGKKLLSHLNKQLNELEKMKKFDIVHVVEKIVELD